MNVKQFVKEIFAQIKRDWFLPVVEHQIYDATERVIGTYMGKPLYRKIITYNNVNAGSSNVPHDITNIDKVVFYKGIIKTSEGSFRNIASFNNSGFADAACVMAITRDDVRLRIGSNYQDLVEYVEVAIDYTKTTDVTTTSKVPFESLTEYSTEERMIGYWIDGKPLYRKTVPVNSETTKGLKTITINIASVETAMIDFSHSFIINQSTKEHLPIMNCWDSGNTGGYSLTPSANSIKLLWYRNIWQQLTGYITLEYTKTTDTA